MEKHDLDLVSTPFEDKSYYLNIRKALTSGFFMQVAHKEGEKGNYLTIKDNQVSPRFVSCRVASSFLFRRERVKLTPLSLSFLCAITQVVKLHKACGLETQPEWVVFNEFVLTTANVRSLSSSPLPFPFAVLTSPSLSTLLVHPNRHRDSTRMAVSSFPLLPSPSLSFLSTRPDLPSSFPFFLTQHRPRSSVLRHDDLRRRRDEASARSSGGEERGTTCAERRWGE